MTHADLRRALLAERYGDAIREAHACLSHATPWTPAEQRAHLTELDETLRSHEADRPRPHPAPGRQLREAVVDGLPPRGGVA